MQRLLSSGVGGRMVNVGDLPATRLSSPTPHEQPVGESLLSFGASSSRQQNAVAGAGSIRIADPSATVVHSMRRNSKSGVAVLEKHTHNVK